MKKLILAPMLAVCLWSAPSDTRTELTDQNRDNVVMESPDSSVLGGSKLEIILSAIIAILGILSKVKWTQARENNLANEILIRAIEMAGDRDVKRAVKAVAESEGHTEFMSRKVNEVTKEPPSPTPPLPPAPQAPK